MDSFSLGKLVGAIMATFKYPWASFNTVDINVGNLAAPSDICSIFKYHDIVRYVYCITHGNIVIKFGMSCPKANTRIAGERVYRQIAHCTSWGVHRITGSSGSDWLEIERAFQRKYRYNIDHRQITIS